MQSTTTTNDKVMSTRSFVVTSASQSASLDEQGRCDVSITVTNSSPKPARAAARPMPLGSTNTAWLTVAGEKERSFAALESHQITVRVQAPPNTPPGRYSFRLNIASVQNPEEDFTEGPEIAFDVKLRPEPVAKPGRFPLWILFVILGVVIAGAVGTWLLWPSGAPVPDVRQKPFVDASNTLAAAHLRVTREDEVTRSNKVGVVFQQEPKPGQKVRHDTTVKLVVEGQPEATAVPDVVGMPVAKVKDIFAAKRLQYSQRAERVTPQNPPAVGTILEQSPKAGTLVDLDSAVALTVESASVAVPNVSTSQSLSAAINALQSARLNAGTVEQRAVFNPAQFNLVVGQDPAPGTRVAPDSKVRLFIGVQRQLTARDWSSFLNTNVVLSRPMLRVVPR